MISRRNSMSNSAKKVYIDKNNISEATEIRVENIADAKLITADELDEIFLSPMRFIEDNIERLNILECEKEPYLFCSDDLLKLVEITTSLKTRIEMINMIGPRLVDPSAKVAAFTGMFRFAEEKHTVEEVLKVRMNAINASKFTNRNGANALKSGAGRGGAGRGGSSALMAGGRGITSTGRGGSRVASLPANLVRSLSPKPSPKALPKTPSFNARPLPTTPGGSSAFVTPVAKDGSSGSNSNRNSANKRKSPELCPEDGIPSNTSPTSQGETGSTRSTVVSQAAARNAPAPAPADRDRTVSELQPSTVRPVPISLPSASPNTTSTASPVPARTRPLPEVPPSPNTPGSDQGSLAFSACSTPMESKHPSVKSMDAPALIREESSCSEVDQSVTVSVNMNVNEGGARRPSATLATALFASVTVDTTAPPAAPAAPAAPAPVVAAATAAVASTTAVPVVETNSTTTATTTTATSSSNSNNSARSTPVVFEITARAPQRGPPPPSSRRGVSAGVAAAGAGAGSTGPSPVPGAVQRSPSITPSVSVTNLQALGGTAPALTAAQQVLTSAASSARSSPSGSMLSGGANSAAPAIVVAPPTAAGSYASQCGTYDLSPMVADCKPEVGVHSLLSKFSGTGGTRLHHSALGSRSVTPVDAAAPAKSPVPSAGSRKISDLANAFAMKPATSTASSTLGPGFTRGGGAPGTPRSGAGSGISAAEARSQAPAPIVIPGASLSLAEMRAKFSGGGGVGSSGNNNNSSSRGTNSSSSSSQSAPATLSHAGAGSQSAVNSPTRAGLLVRSDSHSGIIENGNANGNGNGNGTPAQERTLTRRHSESHFYMVTTIAAANAALAAATAAPAAAEVAGAGADLATRCANVLHMSRAEFLALPSEEAIFTVVDDNGSNNSPALPQFSYREVVRRNFRKEYAELKNQNELELYVCDEDFVAVFSRSKAEYAKLPRWRQVEQKKKAMLF